MDFQWFQPLKNLFSKIRNCKAVKILFPKKMIRNLIKSHHLIKFGMKQ